VRWSGAWQVGAPAVSPRIPTPLCAVATSLLGEQLTQATASELANYAWYGLGARNPADGCLLLGGPSTSGGSAPTGATANVLYRFGLLFAANDQAQRLLPGLPLVDARGQAIASAIAAQPR
jgi:hypothetical protein